MNVPKPLKQGDRVALIAPSSPASEEKFLVSLQSLEFLGFNPIPFPCCLIRNGYLAGDDDARAKDVNDAFADPLIDGIFCMRGGYGATRILPLLDYETIRCNPKFFAGYSDITALHIILNQRCNLVTYHAPMPSTGYHLLDHFSLDSLKNSIFNCCKGNRVFNPPDEKIVTLNPGIASGPITGGNLSVMAAALGSPYEVDTKGKILFIEDVGDPLYRIDRNLTALRLAGKLNDATAIILGVFSDITSDDSIESSGMSLQRVIDQIITPLKKPTINNFRSGHIYPQITIPMGARARLEATANCTKILFC